MIFTIPGEPQGKKRPRYSRRSRTMYTPSETVNYEGIVKTMYHAQGGRKVDGTKKVIDTKGKQRECQIPIKVEIWAFMKPPVGVPMWKRAMMILNYILPTKKPDIDNIGKIILDGLNKVAWHDDSVVTDLIIHKRYDENAHVVVEINEI